MIITISNWVSNIGKTNISIYLYQYLVDNLLDRKIYLFDKTDDLKLFKLYISEKEELKKNLFVDRIFEKNETYFKDENVLKKLQESDDVFLFDLKSNLDIDDYRIIKYSNFILCPFVMDIEVVNTTLLFIDFINKHNIIDDSYMKVILIENFYKLKKDEMLKGNVFVSNRVLNNKIRYSKDEALSFKDYTSLGYKYKLVFEELVYSVFDF